jgi:hypothetical protein
MSQADVKLLERRQPLRPLGAQYAIKLTGRA